jgi:hypothetical protein|tara:strand:- start:1202 stop:1975 length:774 start_codon:yes stop_codon:yes gene_type:complete
MSTNFFALQTNNTDGRKAVESIEMNFRCLKGKDGFDVAAKKLSTSYPVTESLKWVEPLIEAIRPFYQPRQDGQGAENPFTLFIDAMVSKLNGGTIPLFNLNFNLDNFTESELSQPHMQWITLLANRYNQLNSELNADDDIHCKTTLLSLCEIHPCDQISDERGVAIFKKYQDGNFFRAVTFSGFLFWFLKSRALFDVENQMFKPDVEQDIRNTLSRWQKATPEKSLNEHTYWLADNFEIHPLHNEGLSQFVRSISKK